MSNVANDLAKETVSDVLLLSIALRQLSPLRLVLANENSVPRAAFTKSEIENACACVRECVRACVCSKVFCEIDKAHANNAHLGQI